MNRSLSPLFSDGSNESDDHQRSQTSWPVAVDENEEPPGGLCLSLIPSTRVQRDGSVTVHRKHRKITRTAGLETSRKSVSILKELKKSNETLTQKLKKTEKKIRKMEDRLKDATRISKGKSSCVPNGVRVIKCMC